MLKDSPHLLHFENSTVKEAYARYLRSIHSLNIQEVLENIIHHSGPRKFYLVDLKGSIRQVEYSNMELENQTVMFSYDSGEPPVGDGYWNLIMRPLASYNTGWFLMNLK